jgi:diaminopimelate decarboxylase
MPGIALNGLAVHIGSQLTDLAPYRTAFARMAELVRELRQAGIEIAHLDLGGGLGISYRGETPPSLTEYAAIVKGTVGNLGVGLAVEPGRLLVGDAGVLVAKVIYVKGSTRRFIVVDAAMNDLIRPTLYEAWHEIVPVREPARGAEVTAADVAGPICETGDTFATQRRLPEVAAGDLIAILSAGAYGAVMSSTYNSRLLVPEVLVRDGEFAVIRPRQSYEALLAQDAMPAWLDRPEHARGPR